MTRTIDISELGRGRFKALAIWASPSVAEAVDFGEVCEYPEVPKGSRFIVAVGGGSLIDKAKPVARDAGLPLVAVPTLWGSGADASPIAVTRAPDGSKAFEVSEALRPSFRAPWPAMASQASNVLKAWGAADVWSHALEGMTSPLADSETREGLARVLVALSSMDPTQGDSRAWLDRSATACALQARASAGLMHGIAHVLEPHLGWGHSRLIAASAPIVTPTLLKQSPAWTPMSARHSLDAARITTALEGLTTDADIETVRVAMGEHADEILRDPSTRTAGFLVRKKQLVTGLR